MVSNHSPESEKILRKLGIVELIYERELEHKSSILPTAIIIDSKYDLFSNISIFEKAMHIWKTLHPLLRVKIAVDKQFEGQEFTKELYFELVDEKKLMSNDNIEYLRLKVPSSSDDENKSRNPWELLFEREPNIETVNSREGNRLLSSKKLKRRRAQIRFVIESIC